MKKPDLDAYVRGLSRQARAGRKRKARPASPEQLAALNINVEGG